MREVQQIVKDVRSDSFPLNTNIDGIPILTRFSNDSFALSLAYINWETDAIVGIELIRNIGIALGRRREILNFSRLHFLVLSLHLRDYPDHAGQLARVAAGDDVCPAHCSGRGWLHALVRSSSNVSKHFIVTLQVGPHHRHHLHECPDHQRGPLCGLLRPHSARVPHWPRDKG